MRLRPSRLRLPILALAAGILACGAAPQTIRVAYEPGAAPLTFVNEAGEPSGFSAELAQAIAKDQSLDVTFVAEPWDQILKDLRSGDVDAVANMAFSPERTAFVDFSVTDLAMSAGVIYRDSIEAPRSMADLKTLRLGTVHQSLSDEYIRKKGLGSKVILVSTLEESLRKVESGEVDATIASSPVSRALIQSLHLQHVKLAAFTVPDLTYESHLAVPAGRTTLLYKLNAGLANVRASGAYDKLYERWIGPIDHRGLQWRDIRGIVAVSATLMLLLLTGFLFQRRANLRLSKHAAELRLIEGELRRSQGLLNRSAQLLRQTQSVAKIGGWEIELPSGRMFWTEESYRIHGVEPSAYEPSADTLPRFYTPESSKLLAAALEATLTRGRPCDLEAERIPSGPERHFVHVTGRAEVDKSGRVVRAYGSFHDITVTKQSALERDRLQQKMLETQKLESLGVLAGGIAHDFNNILTVVMSHAHLARMERVSPEIEEHLKAITEASRRAAELCQRMLSYAGKGNRILEYVDLSALVRDARPLLEHLVSKKTTLTLDLASPLPATEADAAQLHQVLLNLTVNASEALEDKAGVVRLSTGTTELTAEAIKARAPLSEALPGSYVFLRVEDSGCGMSADTLSKIFDPFFTTKFTGRGLGLAAVHGICRAHHGALTVSSTVGKGTVFELYLPASPIKAKQSSVRKVSLGSEVPPGKYTVLVADDEDTVRKVAQVSLTKCGYSVVMTRDGREAVDAFKAEPDRFAAVVLDLTMPTVDGAEALRAMRSMRPGLRVLVMSGYGEEETLARLRDCGGASFLRKPFTPEELGERLRQTIG